MYTRSGEPLCKKRKRNLIIVSMIFENETILVVDEPSFCSRDEGNISRVLVILLNYRFFIIILLCNMRWSKENI